MTEYLPTADVGHLVPVTMSAHYRCFSTGGQCTVRNHPNLVNLYGSSSSSRGFRFDDPRVIEAPHCTYGVTGCPCGGNHMPTDVTL